MSGEGKEVQMTSYKISHKDVMYSIMTVVNIVIFI